MDRDVRIYRAAPSWGWLSLAVLTVVSVMATLPGLFSGSLIVALLVLPLPAFFLVMLVWFPTIRYELSPETLIMRFGPWRRQVDVAEIKSVSRRSLTPTLLPFLVLPGFAMFYVFFSDVNSHVRMCSTRAVTNLTFIEATSDRRYGISPKDQDEFEARLREYMGVRD